MWAPFCDDYCLKACKTCKSIDKCTHNQAKRFREDNNIPRQVNQHFDNGIWKITSVHPESHRVGRHGIFITTIRVNAPLLMMYINHERGKVDEMYGKCLQTSLIEKIHVMEDSEGRINSIQVSTMNSQYVLDRVF